MAALKRAELKMTTLFRDGPFTFQWKFLYANLPEKVGRASIACGEGFLTDRHDFVYILCRFYI